MIDLRKYIQILETYSEEEGSTFESDGKLYNLNKLFELTELLPIAWFKLDDLSWVLEDGQTKVKYPEDEEARIQTADITIPILVTVYYGEKWLVVDGAHRLIKALRDGSDIIPGRFVTEEMMNACLM